MYKGSKCDFLVGRALLLILSIGHAFIDAHSRQRNVQDLLLMSEDHKVDGRWFLPICFLLIERLFYKNKCNFIFT